MEEKLKKLFTFLSENREFNRAYHTRDYEQIILPYKDKKDRVISLLYNIANTQSQPKIDKLASFYRKIVQDNNNCLNSFAEFLQIVNPKNSKPSFANLYKGMCDQDGWGPKTSALFVKSIYHLHNRVYPDNLKIWDDVPGRIEADDIFHLPVDTVIIKIFKEKFDKTITWDFKKVNDELQERYNYNRDKIEVWDDLWFWGFITQKGSDNREFDWNENKYWALKETDKNPEVIERIKDKSEEFLRILSSVT